MNQPYLMPLCGFNQMMLEGLRQFGEGLYEQAQVRAHRDGLSLHESFDAEIEEMNIFIGILLAKNHAVYRPLLGIAYLAQSLYRNGQGETDPKMTYDKGLERMLCMFECIDEKYYNELRLKHDSKTALRLLGEWMDENTPESL